MLLLALLPLQFVWAGAQASWSGAPHESAMPCPMAMGQMAQDGMADATPDAMPACCDDACPDMLSCALGHPAAVSSHVFAPAPATFAVPAAVPTSPAARALPPLYRPPILSRPG